MLLWVGPLGLRVQLCPPQRTHTFTLCPSFISFLLEVKVFLSHLPVLLEGQNKEVPQAGFSATLHWALSALHLILGLGGAWVA